MSKMKVMWICNFSCQTVRDKLNYQSVFLEPFLMKIFHRKYEKNLDYGIWIVNGIEEIKKDPQVELHVVSVVRDIKQKRQDFQLDGIYYHCVREENSSLYRKFKRYLFSRYNSRFKINRKNISEVVEEVKPDLIHVIGAENPQYSLVLLDIPRNIPTILQLQALLVSKLNNVKGEQKKAFQYKANIEKQLICRADYVGTRVPSFIDFIKKNIKKDVNIVNLTLAMAQKINDSIAEKKFDFVHFAATLGESKATDVAIEAFGLAHKKHPELTLDVIGQMSPEFKQKMLQRIKELGIESAVSFEGRLPTHDDVINQIRKSRFALLPFKISIVPNTIREAMANGIPVITTVTPGTPELNKTRECVLISPKDDVIDLANKVVNLVENKSLQNQLRDNAFLLEKEKESNADIIGHWIDFYKSVITNRKKNTSISHDFFI